MGKTSEDGPGRARLPAELGDLDRLPAALVVLGAGGAVEHVNEQAQDLFGTPSPDLEGTTLAELAERTLSKGEQADLETGVELGDRRLTVRARARPGPDGDLAVVALEDLTEQRERVETALRQERVLEEAQQVAHIGSWEWDIQGDEVSWSDELYRIFGRDPETFEGTFEGYMESIHPEDVEDVQETIDEGYSTGEPFAFDHRIVTPEDEVRHLHCRGQVVLDGQGNPVRMVGTAQDVTEQWETNRRLQSYATRLEEVNRELRHFTWVASHDLKEPLRMVTSYVQMLEKHLGEDLDEDAREYASFVQEGTKRMNELIDDLLAYTRLDGEERGVEPVDLERLVAEVCDQLETEIQERGAEIETEGLCEIEADEMRLSLVLKNLISNAIKFQEPESTPEVKLQLQEGDEAWHLVVEDNGVGFDPEYEEQIFDMFERLHGHQEYPGTGIGLSICRKVVQTHGGEIWADPEPGEGTSIHVEIPHEPDLELEDSGMEPLGEPLSS